LLLAFSLPALLCALWTVCAGKDVNWDLLNYHYYLPFELLAGRLGQDFFAASAQSYLNPVGYLPFYLMVASGWHSVAASVALAAAHSLGIGLLYVLAWKIFAHLPSRQRILFASLATALGAATPVLWMTVGSSFLDPLLVPPMLAGLLLLLDADGRPVSRATLAGLLFGAAAALKYSNAVFALAALPLSLAMPGVSASGRLRAGLGYVAGGALAVLVLAGPWIALLTREFGNPVFPLLNAWFHSPYGPPYNIANVRFTPGDWQAVLSFPFRMAALDRTLYSENFAPDLRFAALIAALIALPALAVRRDAPAAAHGPADWRVLGFFAASFVLWLTGSANARYGLIVLLLVGVCLARMVERVLPAAAARITLSVLLAVQIATSLLAMPGRWYLADSWSKHWLAYQPPERAVREAALYLTIEPLPFAVLAPLVHPDSSFVNFRGQFSLPTDSPKLRALLERHRGHLRTVGRTLRLVDGEPRPEVRKGYDRTLLRIGYRVDAADCFAIPWRSDGEDGLSRAANRLAGQQPLDEELSLVSCALRPAARDPADLEQELRAAALFDRVEQACPAVFRGQTAVTEPLGGGWSRNYSSLDIRLETEDDQLLLNRYTKGIYLSLGRISDWERKDLAVPPLCRR
jgi:hypothetical protein